MSPRLCCCVRIIGTVKGGPPFRVRDLQVGSRTTVNTFCCILSVDELDSKLDIH